LSLEIIDAQLDFRRGLTKRDIKDIDMIILHHSASAAVNTTIYSIHRWHLQRGWLGCGYHYVIHSDGSVFQGRPIDTVGAHARGYNERSVGICVVGNFEEEHPTLRQIESLNMLLDYLKNDKLRGQNISIRKHRDLAATLCPGRNFTFLSPVEGVDRRDEIIKLLEKVINNIQEIKEILNKGRV